MHCLIWEDDSTPCHRQPHTQALSQRRYTAHKAQHERIHKPGQMRTENGTITATLTAVAPIHTQSLSRRGQGNGPGRRSTAVVSATGSPW
jgi:hypothetical protein